VSAALIERYFAAVNSRDWAGLAAVLHPDVSVRHMSLLSADGIPAVVRLYRAILEQYREGEHEDRPTRILVAGDVAAVEITATVVKKNGTALTFPAVDIIDIQDGRIRTVRTFYDTAVVVPLITGEKKGSA
jgi:fatty-acyl-CoA synthase